MKWLLFGLCVLTIVGAGSARRPVAATQADLDDSISSARYIVVDAQTGEVFAEKGAHDQVAIASLTKIFTTIEAIERAPLDLLITTDESDLFDASSTTMGFGPGETFTLEDLLYGMMLASGNDAAHAIARAIGAQTGDAPEESVARFVGWMNERARNLGLTETNLVNPHGLGVPGHYSSAHDVAAFTRYALKYQTFVDIISTSEYDANGYVVTNLNRLLNDYAPLLGGKTGFDEDSGYCLMEVAQDDGETMISVTLDGVAPDVWYQDNVILLEYGFEQKRARLNEGREITGEVITLKDPDAAVVAAMVTAGASLGQAESVSNEAAQTTDATSGAGPPPATDESSDGADWRTMSAVAIAAIAVAAGIAFSQLRPRSGTSATGRYRRTSEDAVDT